MAPASDGPRSALSAPRPVAPLPEEVAECFGGEVFLAYAGHPESGVLTVAAAFGAAAARAKAQARAGAMDVLRRLPDEGAGPCTGADGRRLCLDDFMPEAPAETRSLVAGTGLLSREPYLLPAEVVWLGERDCRVEPTSVGVVDGGVDAAIADLLAHDMVTRWWADPRTPLLRVSEHLGTLIPPGAAAAVPALGLRVSAYVLPGPGFQIAVAGLSGDGTTIAAAAARSAPAAVAEAFLRAVAARAQPWNTLPTADSLRRLTVWHREVDYLAYLEWSALPADPALLAPFEERHETLSWADMACRRFGHEPVLVSGPGGPVKVVCPGAACYRTLPPGTTLPCPVP
ncbi:hypothetical protein Sru01_12530 [Sphaerisporangium rufum]|uniref:Uncharacterized protein n=1 Tax=Sphaerisporangium rufum TaxID=1381558 RepID=A0A919UWR0_9ACTN|nr:hypothetical protein [Sphaerisporangium rufum]GII76271.1 hypothetical protein Sru01_12530 [Sphaerisporangium rufum]